MIEHCNEALDIKRKCELLEVARSSVYYKQKTSGINDDAEILNEIQDIHLEHPYFGYRRVTIELRSRGFIVNHKRVQRLRIDAGIQAVYPKKRTTIRDLNHKIYPYLLKDLIINRPNQVWQVDITYIKMRYGYVYLVCLIDVFSRKIMGWNLSTLLDTQSCLEALEDALLYGGKPEIINSDQGCQFTSDMWTSYVRAHDILISMDGKGQYLC
jgi:putative transposase